MIRKIAIILGACFTLNFTVSFSFTVAYADELTFARYHSQSEIHNYMLKAAKEHSDIVSFHNLGKSAQGRDIDYVVISRGEIAGKPTIYLNGTHHGDEWSSTEGILGLMDRLISKSSEPATKSILDQYAIYLQPLVNPDGHAARQREESGGRDPNRDYSFPGRGDAQSFQISEIQLVKKLVDAIKPRAAAAYHSGIEEVLWSWCYTGQATRDANQLSALGQLTAQAMGMDRYLQSYDDYQTDGEFIDYAYMKYGTLALTVEVSSEKTPAEADLAPVVARSVDGALAMIGNLHAMDQGHFSMAILSGPRASHGHVGASPWHGRRLE